jgi:hypothetical protein
LKLGYFIIHVLLLCEQYGYFFTLFQPDFGSFRFHLFYRLLQLVPRRLYLPDRSLRSLLPGLIFLLVVQQAPYVRCLCFQVICNLLQEAMYILHLPTNCKLTVVDLLTPATKFCKAFGDGGVSLRQGVL